MDVKIDKNNANSDKTQFKVKFLGEYHDVFIDWSDESYEYKQMQLLKQLESITGIPNKGLLQLNLFVPEDVFCVSNPELFLGSNSPLQKEFEKDMVYDRIIRDGECYVLVYFFFFHFCRHTSHLTPMVFYHLTQENLIPEDVCSGNYQYCQSKHSKSVFSKVKSISNNEELLAKIRERIDSPHYDARVDRILMEFNVKQYHSMICTNRFIYPEPFLNLRHNFYLRTHG